MDIPSNIVTVTLRLSGPDAADRAQALVNTISDCATLVPSTGDNLAVAADNVHMDPISDSHVVIDARSRTVLVDGKPISLTRREFDLLMYLADHPGMAYTRHQLQSAVWGHEHSHERTVDVHVGRIRRKLRCSGAMIATVHGFGYRLETAADFAIRRR